MFKERQHVSIAWFSPRGNRSRFGKRGIREREKGKKSEYETNRKRERRK